MSAHFLLSRRDYFDFALRTKSNLSVRPLALFPAADLTMSMCLLHPLRTASYIAYCDKNWCRLFSQIAGAPGRGVAFGEQPLRKRRKGSVPGDLIQQDEHRVEQVCLLAGRTQWALNTAPWLQPHCCCCLAWSCLFHLPHHVSHPHLACLTCLTT